ncbi:hypothetical protein N7509_004745 [Penicillium cosmopolitanum]|uniref:F-box domain-containing protein n=1 Tax=Penicillium cosmopolitanum TaxID=1131564 RepID=A0A9X0B9F9_9EURO|nr:uncharacterized protein N7509_004745 [Penicillium cosmopolitanum]KAJ5396632.1 hypothetical protein N7509_004745 [Penicillium cosmopolitanum]
MNRKIVLDLPVELQLIIISFLDDPSALALSQSCTIYREIIKVEWPKKDENKLLHLAAMQTWEKNRNNLFAYKGCLKLREKKRFWDTGSIRPADAELRDCLNCAAVEERRIKGQLVQMYLFAQNVEMSAETGIIRATQIPS